MGFSHLFSKAYLFEINRAALGRSDKLFLLAGAVLVALAIVFKLAAIFAPHPPAAKYLNRVFAAVLTAGFLEVAWFGTRYQYVKFFGTHFVALLVLLLALAWLLAIAISFLRHYQVEKQAWQKEQTKQKYLHLR